MILQEILEARNTDIYNKFVSQMTVAKLATEFNLTPYYIKAILKKQRVIDNHRFNGRLKGQ